MVSRTLLTVGEAMFDAIAATKILEGELFRGLFDFNLFFIAQ